jgi:hypothetical protein
MFNDALPRTRSFGRVAVAGREEGRVPLGIECLALVVNDPRAFWDGIPHRH